MSNNTMRRVAGIAALAFGLTACSKSPPIVMDHATLSPTADWSQLHAGGRPADYMGMSITFSNRHDENSPKLTVNLPCRVFAETAAARNAPEWPASARNISLTPKAAAELEAGLQKCQHGFCAPALGG